MQEEMQSLTYYSECVDSKCFTFSPDALSFVHYNFLSCYEKILNRKGLENKRAPFFLHDFASVTLAQIPF